MAKIRLPPPNEFFRQKALKGMVLDTALTPEIVQALMKIIKVARREVSNEERIARREDRQDAANAEHVRQLRIQRAENHRIRQEKKEKERI